MTSDIFSLARRAGKGIMSLAKAHADLASAKNDVRRYEGLLEAARQRVLKISHYIEMAEQYGNPGDDAGDDAGHSSPRRPRGGVSGDAVNAVIGILRERKVPTPTRELVELLRDKGIVVGGPPGREIINLSGYLSRTPELANDRVKGWRLKAWDERQTGDEVEPPLTWSKRVSVEVVRQPDSSGAASSPVPPPMRAAEWESMPTRAAQPTTTRKPLPPESTESSWDAPKADLDDDIPF